MVEYLDVSHLITEDETPVDNVGADKQHRLLVEVLYASWRIDRPFFAASNVGLFASLNGAAIVPDMLLSLDVLGHPELWNKDHRSYFMWDFGKPPDVVVEVVSNNEGGETTRKMRDYARIGVPYYVIFDPMNFLLDAPIAAHALHAGEYFLLPEPRLPRVGLNLVLWEGTYEKTEGTWMRWTTAEGELIPTGAERADAQQQRADSQQQRADSQQQRADALEARLRALGHSPDT